MPKHYGDEWSDRALQFAQTESDEARAVAYFTQAINDGEARVLLADLNMLDGILRELGMQETDKCPIERIRALMKINT